MDDLECVPLVLMMVLLLTCIKACCPCSLSLRSRVAGVSGGCDPELTLGSVLEDVVMTRSVAVQSECGVVCRHAGETGVP